MCFGNENDGMLEMRWTRSSCKGQPSFMITSSHLPYLYIRSTGIYLEYAETDRREDSIHTVGTSTGLASYGP